MTSAQERSADTPALSEKQGLERRSGEGWGESTEWNILLKFYFFIFWLRLPCQAALDGGDSEGWSGFVKLSERLRSLASARHGNVTAAAPV